VRKSLLSALIGNAVARGEIDLKKTIGELGIDDNEPSLSPEEKDGHGARAPGSTFGRLPRRAI